MKNRALNKYLARIAIFTAAFAAGGAVFLVLFFLVGYPIFTNILSGVLRTFAAGVYDFVYRNWVGLLIAAYLIGIACVTIYTVSRLGRLLSVAEKSVSEENPEIFKSGCPEELSEFAASLKSTREAAIRNEQARQIAEQQKNDLIVYLAHDLKTPLTSVIGYLTILDEMPDLPPEQRSKFVGITLSKAYRLEQLINEFFEITRLNLSELSAEKTTVDLSVMLFQLSEEFYPLLTENRMTLITDIDSGIKLSADADKLARALDNLLRNAVNYGWCDSEITLSAHLRDADAVVTLTNKGDEIPQEKLPRLFDRFCRLDSARKSSTGGAGLGLAITKQIIKLHGGTIIAECEGNDITFTVTLPL